MIQKIAEQQNGKSRHQGNTANSRIQDYTHTSENTNVKVWEVALPARTIHCNHIATAILYTLRPWLF